ncbi:glycoside hydrolase family 30 protein [Pedobacter yulinensis]|nr:glycoside hydrolase family 30 beta sandwich domain-containing protein [Pedobacter yulinensis]
MDQRNLLAAQRAVNLAGYSQGGTADIIVDQSVRYQPVEGFGFALTGGSAQHLIAMDPAKRKMLLRELFGREGIGISYLRLSIGASDLNAFVFSYNDLPAGETDVKLEKFSLAQDELDVVPVLKEILAISPDIRILGSPWSAPVWMKSNGKVQGGRLKDEYYDVYGDYFIRYIRAMSRHGIRIDAVTVQNEPFNDGNTPSMQFLAKEQLRFVRDYLGPKLAAAGLKTKLILYDHNCDAPEYPIAILTDPQARKYVAGTGFHLYAGPVSAMSKVHDAFPDKGLYFTEMMAVNRKEFNVAAPVARIVIGATRNWSRNVILWNLAADQNDDPHTGNGGCSMCQGAITIEGNQVTRNLAYYTIAHASKFVPPGSVRIASTSSGPLAHVAFSTPGGQTVLLVANNSKTAQEFTAGAATGFFKARLEHGSVVTYTW